MEVTHRFEDKGLIPTFILARGISETDGRSEELRTLIKAVNEDAAAATLDVEWFFKIAPMNHGIRDAAVNIGLCTLTHYGGLNMPMVEFDLSQYAVITTFLQRSQNQFSVMVVDEVKIYPDNDQIEFIFSI